MKYCAWLYFIIVALSCNTKPGEAAGQDTLSQTGNDIIEVKAQAAFTAVTPNDSTINISFLKDAGKATVQSAIKGVGSPITVNVDLHGGKQITTTLLPEDSSANIRINQFFTPDGKADGPFGRQLSKPVTKKGTYKLIIGESLMASEAYKGKFSLTVKLE